MMNDLFVLDAAPAVLLSLDEVIGLTDLSRPTLYRWKKSGKFPQSATPKGQAPQWNESEVFAWLEASKPAPAVDVLEIDNLEANNDSAACLIENPVTVVTTVTANEIKACSGYDAQNEAVTAVTDGDIAAPTVNDAPLFALASPDKAVPFDPAESLQRPCFYVAEQTSQTFKRRGVWSLSTKETKEGLVNIDQWICTPLYVDATTSNEHGADFGRKLRFIDSLGRWKTWAMPMALLSGRGDELRGELLSMGALIDSSKGFLLSQYLMSQHPKMQLLAACRVGWHGDCFVLPDRTIGNGEAVYQTESAAAMYDAYGQAGTLATWQADLSMRAVNNPLLIFSICCAFAAPLLLKLRRDGGIFHLIGDSSTGKSTAAAVAASVWGKPSTYKIRWRATGNGLEGIAASRNDGLLWLDEIGEADPKEIGNVVYMLSDGVGKARASKYGGSREPQRWRCITLSTGEVGLSDKMAEAGKAPKAGQAVRFVELSAHRSHNLDGTASAFDCLHGFADGRVFADAIADAAEKHYGHAGIKFLEALLADKDDHPDALAEINLRFIAGSGQEGRAAERIALIAYAGELATRYGVTGWQSGEAIEAALVLFTAWQGERSTGNHEASEVTRKVGDFIDKYGDLKFTSTTDAEPPKQTRAGWFSGGFDGDPCPRVYHFTTSGLKEALKGSDFKRSIPELVKAGWIKAEDVTKDGGKVMKIMGTTNRVYSVLPVIENAKVEAEPPQVTTVTTDKINRNPLQAPSILEVTEVTTVTEKKDKAAIAAQSNEDWIAEIDALEDF